MLKQWIIRVWSRPDFDLVPLSTQLKVMVTLLDRRANSNEGGGGGGNPLMAGALTGKTPVAEFLIDKDADVNCEGGKYGYALQAAAYREDLPMMDMLIKKGANVNATAGEYMTALNAAMSKGGITTLKVAKILLEHGADVNVRDKSDSTAV